MKATEIDRACTWSLRRVRSAPRRAAALVELAIAMPVLLLIGFGCLDLGRVFYDQATLSFAVRQGVISGCQGNFNDAQLTEFESKIRGEIIREMQTLSDFDESLLQVSIDVQREGEEGFLLIVEAEYPFSSIFSDQFIELDLQLFQRMAARRFQ